MIPTRAENNRPAATFNIVVLLLASSLFAQNAECLGYDQKIFDSDTCCWRKLSTEKEYGKSAALVVEFIKTGKVSNKQSLNWHAGQMFAFAGNDRLALKYFCKTYSVFQKWFGGNDGRTWYFFAKGTSAFIRRDKQALEKIISMWKRKLPIGKNFNELQKLFANWDNDYKSAASGTR